MRKSSDHKTRNFYALSERKKTLFPLLYLAVFSASCFLFKKTVDVCASKLANDLGYDEQQWSLYVITAFFVFYGVAAAMKVWLPPEKDLEKFFEKPPKNVSGWPFSVSAKTADNMQTFYQEKLKERGGKTRELKFADALQIIPYTPEESDETSTQPVSQLS